jgi:RNA polymerase-binding transcription factor DksA
VSKRKQTHDDELQKKAAELERLKNFIDETAFGGDEREMTGEISAVDQHPADVSDFVFERELQETARQILEEEAIQVREAMERRAEGKYGICEECGITIPPDRLEARPSATLCIDCQRVRDRAHAA